MKKLCVSLALAALCLSLLMYPRAYSAMPDGLESVRAFLKLSEFPRAQASAEPADPNRTQVVFMFDDGWASVYTQAYPLLREYGYRGSVAVIPGMAREREYLSYSRLAEMYMDGWDILNHSYSHREGMYERSDELLNGFMRAREWLERHRFILGKNHAIAPFGDCNPYLIPLLMKNGFESIRTSDNVLLLDRDASEYFPVTTIHLLTDVSVEETTAELAACAGGGAAVLFNLHKIGEGADATQMTFSPEKLRAIIEFLHENEDAFEVVTYSRLLDRVPA